MTFLRMSSRSRLLVEHDLFRKPVSTFRDHALGCIQMHRIWVLSFRAECSSMSGDVVPADWPNRTVPMAGLNLHGPEEEREGSL
jgi:hypothetical protein